MQFSALLGYFDTLIEFPQASTAGNAIDSHVLASLNLEVKSHILEYCQWGPEA
jgi:hypothetical protein